MKQKKWKMIGVRIGSDMHSKFFDCLNKASDKSGRPMKASEVLVPAIQDFISRQK